MAGKASPPAATEASMLCPSEVIAGILFESNTKMLSMLNTIFDSAPNITSQVGVLFDFTEFFCNNFLLIRSPTTIKPPYAAKAPNFHIK